MPRLRRLAVFVTLLALGGGLAAMPASAQHATARAAAVDDDADAVDEPEVDLDAEEPAVDGDTGDDVDLCELDATQEDDPAVDASPDDDAPVDQDTGDDAGDPDADEPDAGDDDAVDCAEQDEPELTKGATVRLSRAALLHTGRVDAGHLRAPRGAVVSVELLIGRGARVAATKGRALGHVRVVAHTAGEVHLVVRLDRAGRRTLRTHPALRTLTVRTVVRPRHGTVRVTRGTLRLTARA